MLTPPAADSLPETAAPTRPRVLLLGWEYAPRLTGGLGTASVRLAHALAERVELSVIVPRLPDAAPDEDEAETPLSALATAADGPDALRHFPESADWSNAPPPRPRPATTEPVSAVFADGEGAPPAPTGTAAGQPVRLTALSQLTPAAVRAATAPPRPPRYEVFARQVRHIVLDVLPYAEPASSAVEEQVAQAYPISEDEYRVSEDGYRVSEDGYPISEGAYRVSEDGYPISEGAHRIPEDGYRVSADAYPVSSVQEPISGNSDDVVEPPQDASAEAVSLLPDSLAESLAPFQLPAINPLTLPSSNTEVVQFARLAARVASGDAVDVVYAHDWPTFLAGVEIRLEKKVPLVLHVHSTSYDRHGPPVQGWVAELERAAFRAADRVVAVSHYGARVLQQHYGVAANRIHVVHHGLSAGPLGPQWEARPVGAAPTVLFVGRLTSQKNPLGFIEVARLVAAQVPNVRFAVAGDGPQAAAVQAAADEAGFDEYHFGMLGFLDDRDVTAALGRAAVVCLPARSEPFGLAALEAAAAGVPLVLSTTTGAAEVLRGALTADFDDAPALAAHVLTLLRDEPTRRRVVRENAAEARRLTWERAADEVLAVLTGAASG